MSQDIIETALRRAEAHRLLDTDEVLSLRRRFLAESAPADEARLETFFGALEELGLDRGRAMDLVSDVLGIPPTGQRRSVEAEPDGSRATAGAAVPATHPRGPSAPTRPGGHRTATDNGSWAPAHYEVLEKIGSGAVGDVYRARDLRLGREVALKAMTVDGPFDRERFLLEARHQARVDHPAVCRVYEVGEHAQRPFLAMQLIEGRTLRDLAPELSTEQKVELIRQVAEGVHAAHATGLIHRDLKPANIMVASTEEGLRAYVLDFGIAREEGGPSLTRTGMVVGTPWYMAPEQVAGRGAPLDRRTDVYGLGTVLYELFAGTPPFAEESSMVVLTRVLTEEAPRLREALEDAPRDLERIVEQCLRKNPGERYDSARALAEDLARYLAGEPVMATDGGVFGRARRWVRRHRALAAACAVAIAATIAFATTAVRSRLVAERTARAAQNVGREVERAEWLLRAARQLPLQDLTVPRQSLRERLARFGDNTVGLGERGSQIERYVLGRGALMLGDLDGARQALESAWNDGYREADVAEALGWTLARLYDREESLVRGLESAEDRGRRLAELERTLLQPAREYLDIARRGGSELGDLVQAQMAFYERRWEAAQELIAKVERESPWLHEATALRGRILVARMLENSEHVDRAQDLETLRAAEERFLRALEVGRSDQRIYLDLCDLGRERLHLLVVGVEAAEAEYRRTLEHCSASLLIDPEDLDGYLSRAMVHMAFLQHLDQAARASGDVRRLAERDARSALDRDPQSAAAFEVLGVVEISEAMALLGSGEDPRPAARSAIVHLERALELQPRRESCYQRIAEANWIQGHYVEGSERIGLLRSAEQATRRLLEIDPLWPGNVASAGNSNVQLGDALDTNGLDPTDALDRALELYRDAVSRDPQAGWVHSNLSIVHLIRSRFLLRHGIDPTSTLTEARSAVEQALELQRDDPFALFNLGESYRQEARWLTLGGVPPETSRERFWSVIDRGREAYTAGLDLGPRVAQAWVDQARFDVMAAEVLLDLGRPSGEPLERLARARGSLQRSEQMDARRAAAPCELSLVAVLEMEARAGGRRLSAAQPGLAAVERCVRAGARNADYLRSGLRAAWRLASALPVDSRPAVVDVGVELARQAESLQPDFAEARGYAAALELLADPPSQQAQQLQRVVEAVVSDIAPLRRRFAPVLAE